jgi:murein biosynthesis integral membrane protein MurJ
LFRRITASSVLKSTAGLLCITFLVKIAGYVEKLVLANYYGTSAAVDIYTVALTMVLSLFFFFREVIEPGFLNVFLKTRNDGNEPAAWSLFNYLFRIVIFITLAISIIAVSFPGIVSGIFAPGFEGEKLALSNQLIRIAIPACIFLALSTLTSITLNGLKLFVLPASGELAFKAGIVICMVLLYKEAGIIGAAIGIVVGSALRLGVHLIKLYNHINFRKARIDDQSKRMVWQLTWPLLLGVGFSQVSSLVDNVFASYLQEGAIAALSYSRKVVELPVVIFPYVLSIVVFPYFTQLAVEKNKEKLVSLLTESLKWIVIAFIPISVFFVIYATPVIQVIFERGAFNSESTLLTSQPFASIQRVWYSLLLKLSWLSFITPMPIPKLPYSWGWVVFFFIFSLPGFLFTGMGIWELPLRMLYKRLLKT